MFLLLLTFIFISEIAFHEEVEYFISPNTHQTSRCRVSYSIDSVFDPLGSGIIRLNVITYTIFSLLNTLSLRNHFHNISYNDMKTEDASYNSIQILLPLRFSALQMYNGTYCII